jgi:hypothetical protein
MRNDRRYLDYLDNQDGEKRGQKTKDLLVRETALSTPKSLLFNRDPFSQAGRRRFESGLPLQKHLRICALGEIPLSAKIVGCTPIPGANPNPKTF